MQQHCNLCGSERDATDHVRPCRLCKYDCPCANCRPHEEYCPKCYDIILLQRNPRINFQPDSKVCIEYNLIPNYNSRKRKTAPPAYGLAAASASQAKVACTLSGAHSKIEESKNQEEETTWNPALINWDALKTKTLFELAEMKYPDYKPTFLAKTYPHPLDQSVFLDESEYVDENGVKNHRHNYYVRYEATEEMESENNLSTSTMTHAYFGEFDDLDGLRATLLGKNWGPKHPKYAHLFTRDRKQLEANLLTMLHAWKETNKIALSVGRFVHFLIECDMNGCVDLATHPLYAQYANIRQYNRWKAEFFTPFYVPYRTEFRWRSCKKYRHVGTSDLLAVRKDHPPPNETNDILYVIDIDWKNAQLKTTGFNGKKGIDLCSDLDDCSLVHYTLQQSDYGAFASQTMYDGHWKFNGHVYKKLVFESKNLVCFHENNPGDRAIVVPLEDQTSVILQMWEKRAIDVAAWYEADRPKLQSKHKPQMTDEQRRKAITVLVDEVQRDLFKMCKKTIYDDPTLVLT